MSVINHLVSVSPRMKKDNETIENRNNYKKYIVISLISLMIYFLSPVPVLALLFKTGIIYNSPIVSNIFNFIYFPIEFLSNIFPIIKRFYDLLNELFGLT